MRTLLVLALTALAAPPPAGWASGARASRFAWPLAPPHQVVRAFDRPVTEYAPGHRGVDVAASPGTPVLAAGDGVVVHAGPVADRAVVSLRHASGLRTTYEPVEPAVVRGQPVRRGTVIGTVTAGHEGCPTTACLHWGAIRPTPPPGTYLDPLRLLAPTRLRLLPHPTNPASPSTITPPRAHPARIPRTTPPQPASPQPAPTLANANPNQRYPNQRDLDPAHHQRRRAGRGVAPRSGPVLTIARRAPAPPVEQASSSSLGRPRWGGFVASSVW
ncbi:M23 family metallopeptidase [Actinosynnema sp. NPDC053489]|uniref:M23 family metallopeptidase n=1 Tax=Actinosynnema sp. NPDC053489 TaxID=3363916 RepID=UPI0037C77FCD